MLQRDRLIRTQIQQLADASLFAMSFWLAYVVRSQPFFSAIFGLDTIPPEAFERVVWLYFAIVPAAPRRCMPTVRTQCATSPRVPRER